DGNLLARFDAADDLDAVADAIAGFQLANGESIAVHHENPVDAVPILQRAVRQRENIFDPRRLDVHAREGAGLELRIAVRHERLEGKGARLSVHGGTDARNLPGERLLGKRVDVEGRRLP